MKQKNEPIAVVKTWATDVVDGTSSISSMDMLVYITMRCYAKGASDITLAQYATGDNSIEWVCELRADMMNAKTLRNILYDVSKNFTTKYTNTIKQSIGLLIDNGMVVCYNEVVDKSYTGSEFLELCDKWNSDDIVYYFPVPADYYFVPANDVLKIIKCCKKNKELSVDYYMMLYLMVRFNFSISKIPERCYMRAPRATYFTGRRFLWDKAARILKESVGIYCVASRYGVVGENIGTQQNFFENEESYQNFLANKDNINRKFDDDGLSMVDDSYFGGIVDFEELPQIQWEKEEKKTTKKQVEKNVVKGDYIDYTKHPFVIQYETNMERLLAESCAREIGFPPTDYLTLDERQMREKIARDWEEYKKVNEI